MHLALSQRSVEYLRVASITVAAYDFLLTLQYEYRFYSTQTKRKWPSVACTLFFLIRYSSALIIVITGIGYYASFTEAACNRYYLLAQSSRVLLQVFISQIILAVRTYAISRRSRTIAVVLVIALVICTVGEAVGSIYARVPNRGAGIRNCTSSNGGVKLARLHYVFGIAFDALTLIISSYYLIGPRPWAYFSFNGVVRTMLTDGLGYFAVLTVANIINILFWTSASQKQQNMAASLGYAFTMIGSQRILINLQGIADHSSNMTLPRPPMRNVATGTTVHGTHEMAIRVTIQQDIEACSDDPDAGTKR
ncbi:hypothetical protein BKA62DRAFT_619019 [Auriculariales sp. MPI-PUGE-AT-0066]|nr:hypothetical protein BKA62DRAFT_619019 [Auriculariales sp. MPI-PUGE-AT-0066]